MTRTFHGPRIARDARSYFIACSLLTAAVAHGGCGANMAPVLNPKDVPVVTAAQGAPTTEQVRAAIVAGLAAKGWTVQSEEGLALTAETSSGGHTASVTIEYSSTRYSIHHLNSSEGLKYDGQEIHRRYNHWIDLLQQAINAELAKVNPPPPLDTAAEGPPDAPPPAPAPEAAPAPAPEAAPESGPAAAPAPPTAP
jgi:hypothetical protein